jgi:hypothetical protein
MDLVSSAAADLFADDPPRFLAQTPHGYRDRDAVIAELRNAGFVNVAAETPTRRGVAPSRRDLLYTGVTRGKKLVVLVGQKKAVAIAVRSISGRRRWSKLREWLAEPKG